MNNLAVTNQDRRLNKNTSMKIHKNFFDYNVFFRIAHFIQSTGRHKFFERRSFLRFRFLTIIFGPLIVKKGFPTLENAWKFLYPPSFLKKHNINLKRWALQIISYIFEFFFEKHVIPNIMGTKIGPHLNNAETSLVKKSGINGVKYVSIIRINMYINPNTIIATISGDL